MRADGDRHVPRPEGRALRRSREGARRPGRGRRDRHPARRAAAGERAGLISDRVLELVPPRPRDGQRSSSPAWWSSRAARAGLTGAPTMAALAAMRTGARLRAGGGAGVDRADVRPEADGGDDAAACPRTTAPTCRRASRPVLELCERAGARRAGPGHRPDRRRARVGARGRAPAPSARADRRGRAERARGRLESLRERPAPTVLTPHEGELGRLLELDRRGGRQAPRLACAREAAERSGARGAAQGRRHARGAPGGPGRRQPRRDARRSPRPAPATCCPG